MRHFLILLLLLIAAATLATGQESGASRDSARKDAIKKVNLRIDRSGWGRTRHSDLSAVLKSSCSELAVHFDDETLRKLEPIRIRRGQSGPITHFQRTIRGEVVVLLSSKDTYWSQQAYQMAHEFGHIVCGFKKGDKTNLWFEESLCELASIFVIRQMAISWQSAPPYRESRYHKKDYWRSLDQYADDLIEKHSLPKNVSLASWYRSHAKTLSTTPTDRALNGKVAVKLLPLFEKNPKNWRTVSYLNKGRGDQKQTFKQYLSAWHQHCPAEQKPFVIELGKQFGVIP